MSQFDGAVVDAAHSGLQTSGDVHYYTHTAPSGLGTVVELVPSAEGAACV